MQPFYDRAFNSRDPLEYQKLMRIESLKCEAILGLDAETDRAGTRDDSYGLRS